MKNTRHDYFLALHPLVMYPVAWMVLIRFISVKNWTGWYKGFFGSEIGIALVLLLYLANFIYFKNRWEDIVVQFESMDSERFKRKLNKIRSFVYSSFAIYLLVVFTYWLMKL